MSERASEQAPLQAVPALGSAAAPAAPATLPVPLGGSPAAPQVVSAFATSGSARGDLALDAAPRDAPSQQNNLNKYLIRS